MNPYASSVNPRIAFFRNPNRLSSHPARHARFHRVQPGRVRHANSPRPSLDLSRACLRESSVSGQWESYTLLFLGGCAFAVLIGCLFHLERCAAHWTSFESFVRALVA